MAVTKIHAINATVGRAIDYICNPHKTDDNVLVTTFACGRETAEYDFRFALGKTNSPDKNIAYHLIQSFAPGEISGEEAHQIGKELADRFLQGRYSYVFATHIDREHIHNHIVFAAADNIDHHKFRSTFRNYYRIRDISDELCAEHNKSVIKDFKETGKTYNEWYHAKKGDSWKSQVKKDINECIKAALSYEEFLRLLREKGYEIHGETFGEGSAKYISFRPFGKDRFVRGRANTLGPDYTKERIKERIEENSLSPILKNLRNDDTIPTKLVSIPEEKKAGSIGLAKYEDKENLHRIATMYEELGTLGLQSREELRSRIKELNIGSIQDKRIAADLDKKIREFRQILSVAKRYAENKKYGDNYLKSKDKERYEREHDYQLRLFEGAKSWLKNTGIDPGTLKIRDIEEHLQKLEADRKTFLASSKAKAVEHEKLKSMEESLTKFLDEPDISEPIRHKDQNRGI
ncbi:MAG: relaxase/mobilization nuclease domain-containing protein [Butyrivibrio sp.]|nr:relaxase/mobilization nuclease domain-containing protein [Butyrivibrio sp.]